MIYAIVGLGSLIGSSVLSYLVSGAIIRRENKRYKLPPL